MCDTQHCTPIYSSTAQPSAQGLLEYQLMQQQLSEVLEGMLVHYVTQGINAGDRMKHFLTQAVHLAVTCSKNRDLKSLFTDVG